jgi:hypothetical protein
MNLTETGLLVILLVFLLVMISEIQVIKEQNQVSSVLAYDNYYDLRKQILDSQAVEIGNFRMLCAVNNYTITEKARPSADYEDVILTCNNVSISFLRVM